MSLFIKHMMMRLKKRMMSLFLQLVLELNPGNILHRSVKKAGYIISTPSKGLVQQSTLSGSLEQPYKNRKQRRAEAAMKRSRRKAR